MTDAAVSEDGKTLSFCLPELTPYALSQKAVATDLRKDGGSIVSVIWICGGILAVCALGAGAVIFVMKRTKGNAKK